MDISKVNVLHFSDYERRPERRRRRRNRNRYRGNGSAASGTETDNSVSNYRGNRSGFSSQGESDRPSYQNNPVKTETSVKTEERKSPSPPQSGAVRPNNQPPSKSRQDSAPPPGETWAQGAEARGQ